MTPRAGAHDDWVEEEGRLLAVVVRTLLRPLRRPAFVGGIALGLTVLAIGLRALQPPLYQGTIFFRVEETGLADTTSSTPRAPRQIKEQVSNVALSRRQLEEIMRKHEISLAWLERDREGAIADFRDEITIDVSRDYFVLQRRPGDPPRSAHVSVSLTGNDKDEVTQILREIGEAILRSQKSERSGDFTGSSQLLRAELAAARASMEGAAADGAQASGELAGARGEEALRLRARVAALELERAAALRRVVALERRVNELEMGVSAEEEQLELSFGSFDEGLLVLRPPLGPGQLARRGIGVLIGAVILVTVLLGAFDDRIVDPEDLTARGLPVLGALPRFTGDGAGAYLARTATPKAG